MTRLYIFFIRIVMGAVFAVILSRFFFPDANIFGVAGLGVFLVGMAYVLEYFRLRKAGKREGDNRG